MKGRTKLVLFACLVCGVLPCCGGQGVNVRGLPDGSYEFACKQALPQCLDYARDVCKGGSYEVLHGADELSLYGTPGANVEAHRSRAIVRCLRPGEPPRGGPAPLAPEEPAPAPAASVAPRPGSNERAIPVRAVCVPGTTQVCVGPGACSGGQACLADGKGFSPCDCASATPPATRETPSPP